MQYEVLRTFEVEYGPIGPPIDKLSDGTSRYLPGGGDQIKLRYKDFENAVANKEKGYTKNAYLRVAKNTKLSQA